MSRDNCIWVDSTSAIVFMTKLELKLFIRTLEAFQRILKLVYVCCENKIHQVLGSVTVFTLANFQKYPVYSIFTKSIREGIP